MKQLATIGLVMLLMASGSRAQQAPRSGGVSLESLLVTGKASGACGILTLQLEFQENTKMAGGNEFLGRFWSTESARLGMTTTQYAEHCASALSMYGKFSELAQQVDSPPQQK